MGRCVIKATPDEDLYLEWSSIVDACTMVRHPCRPLAAGHRPDALDRADRIGTSDRSRTSAPGVTSLLVSGQPSTGSAKGRWFRVAPILRHSPGTLPPVTPARPRTC